MGLRGTAAPFAASALLGLADPRVVLLIGVVFMTAGAALMAGAARVPRPAPILAAAAQATAD